MGRVVKEIDVDSKKLVALFDTGSGRSYIKKGSLPKDCPCVRIDPFTVGLGGKEREIKERCLINGRIENLGFDFTAHPVDEIGKVEEKEIDVIIGSTTMEEWNIIPIPDKKELDLTGLRKREFTEF